jgi:hypothetical protein
MGSVEHNLRVECHRLFDSLWKHIPNKKTKKAFRKLYYEKLAKVLCIESDKCHFSMMDIKTLSSALKILQNGFAVKQNIQKASE